MITNHGLADQLEIEAMRLGVDYRFQIKLGSIPLYLRPLSNSEMMEAHSAVQEHVAALPPRQKTRLYEDNCLAREFLTRASSPFGQFAPQITKDHLDKMTMAQVMYLYKEWLAVCEKVDPQLEKIPPEKMAAIVETLKKNMPEDLDSQLTELSFGELRNLVAFLLTKGD